MVCIFIVISLLTLKAKPSFEHLDRNTWKKDLFAWDASPVDLSFLNHKPAGKFGPVRAEGDRLVFGNGKEARFWGVNIQAFALFQTEAENITAQAKRMAKLGINLVRIHHHDSAWVSPNVFEEDSNDTRSLRVASMEKLDQWIKALQDEGIYIWLDLHVGRKFRSGDDIFGMEETGGELKSYSYFNESIQARMLEFQEQYLSHKNALTGLQYKSDPAIMGLLITNENDLTRYGGHASLENEDKPLHSRLFNEDRYETAGRMRLSYKNTHKTWLPGESKIYLSDVEHRFNRKMLAGLEKLGIKVPIATTNLWGEGAAYSVPALTDGSIIDTHAYGEGNELSKNPRNEPGFLTQTALGAVYGMPVANSEWNVAEDGVRDRYYMPLYTAAIASLQGWDAMMLYGYSQTPLNQSTRIRNWSSYNDPALMGTMPAAALLYRQGHVAVARQTYCLKFSRESLFYKAYKGSTSKAIRTLLEQHRFTVCMPSVKELPWLKETTVAGDIILVTDPLEDFIPAGQNFVESDTKELHRDWEKGIHTINTKRSQAANGWIGGSTIELADVKISIDTSNALAVVQSLGEKPITSARQILITIIAQVAASDGGRVPFWSEPVSGTISIRAKPGKKLYALGPDGKKSGALKTSYSDGRYTIIIPDGMPSHWLILE